jgi:hypothetical protein
VSIEAIYWALNHAPIPTDRKDASSLAIVLIGLANHAGPDGRNAFPSAAMLTRYTRLSESTVPRSLDGLEELGLTVPSDPAIVAACARAHAEARSLLLPVCGQCDARESDPVSARVIWQDEDHSQSTPCRRCHPHASKTGGANQ